MLGLYKTTRLKLFTNHDIYTFSFFFLFVSILYEQTAPIGYVGPYQGLCEHSNQLYDTFSKGGMYTDILQGAEVCATYCNAYSGIGYVGYSTKDVGGECSCHFDDGSMPFPAPEGTTEVNDRLTIGPVTDGTNWAGYQCFAYSVRLVPCCRINLYLLVLYIMKLI